ncbi:hypothetical protein [Streptomyces mirabilis]|uniref:hypothetical protein n=1 Tax=Streptomyces mirabilis TaxID=68239 RepID=UPI0036939BB6
MTTTNTTRLQGVGWVPAIEAAELKVGDQRMYNGGSTTQITKIEDASAQFLKIYEVSTETGEEYTSRVKKTSMVAYVPEEHRRRLGVEAPATSYRAQVRAPQGGDWVTVGYGVTAEDATTGNTTRNRPTYFGSVMLDRHGLGGTFDARTASVKAMADGETLTAADGHSFRILTPEEPTPATVADVEDVDYRMFVGVLFEEAKDMGLVRADGVREAIKNNAAEGHRAVRTEDGMVHVYYSWFVPQRAAVEEDAEQQPRPAAEVLAADPIPAGTSVLEGMPEGKVTSASIDGMYVVQKRHGDHWALPNHDDPRVISHEYVITGLSYVRQRGGKVGQDLNGTIYASNGRQAERYIPAALFSDLVEGQCPGCKTLDASNGDGPCTGGRSLLAVAIAQTEEERPKAPTTGAAWGIPDTTATNAAITADYEREAAELLGEGERWNKHYRQFGEEPREDGPVTHRGALGLLVWALREGWRCYRADAGGINLESTTGESSYWLEPVAEDERFRPVERIRPGWQLRQADGAWKTVHKVNEKNGPHCVVRVEFADGATDDLPVNTEAYSRTAAPAEEAEEEVTPTPRTVYLVALAEPVKGYTMAGTTVRTEYLREFIRSEARRTVKAARIGTEGIIRVGALMFIPQGLTTA